MYMWRYLEILFIWLLVTDASTELKVVDTETTALQKILNVFGSQWHGALSAALKFTEVILIMCYEFSTLRIEWKQRIYIPASQILGWIVCFNFGRRLFQAYLGV